ncbi:phosphoribosyl-AMP cyclohydrolase [Cryobacterium sp. TMT1-21]|uniref:Phosphoribosyl-AMP cyclohydrolase n=1 Tax=Cryobacterium shii TaxID=1259235 RepID=A0AAQ2C852_9MICO|nr:MULTISPECIES: phosphoribosyl-AMP cyclohydrolase [Cryobacterium]TFC51630.1 phosphoribosyl-AMP cyclohydrolase [Cryobacterium shii]TFC83625.1 phosphoribosyl-AMP cyclohydrolase [Cryobacterium sp. TmT2-59]TFD13598.1 phosphoribosyl-AMP cyclohydrolase [Cryobacterium sp. TMT4-10]TFD16040.1 phosphoribosyl-AMP cyclohydrolase [Cryobacterium sp. TMT1-21]TFD27130.1 phosphoribosyl-AMP cyclohydrolase [Cryobacterium sp. TMT2-23]
MTDQSSTPQLSAPDEALQRAVFNSDGLLPAVVQQWDTGEVLMLGWMNREAMRRTLTEGRVTFWSRSRQEYWRKGDTSGHGQYVKSAALDCDADTLLVQVDQVGAACHTGTRTCFVGRGIEVVAGARPSRPAGSIENADQPKE